MTLVPPALVHPASTSSALDEFGLIVGESNIIRTSDERLESYADGVSATEEGVPDEIRDALLNPYAEHGQG